MDYLIHQGTNEMSEIEIYVIPELLGCGQPPFQLTGLRASPKLISAAPIARGCVRLHYHL
jgi:hypothetical protein